MKTSPKAVLVRRLALRLEGVEEVRSYGTAGFKVHKKLFARLHQDGGSLVVAMDPMDRDLALRVAPEVFFLTDHYVPYPWVLVHLSVVTSARLAKILADAWAFAMPEAKRRTKRRAR